jgi:hypothetical protein
MIDLTLLQNVELVPVLELEPWRFSARDRPRPQGSVLEAWHVYWLDCLSDAGITGLKPLRPGSWDVLVPELDDGPTLENILILDGGLALFSKGELLVLPTCCSDLGNISEWRDAAGYQKSEWRILWTGHPSLSVRYDGGLLEISEPHESDMPSGRWAVAPVTLARAVDAAQAELENFAWRLEQALVNLGWEDRAPEVARRLVGFAT